ncbi:MAG: 16S rRNA (uracil(1498)-N(3))-methyltransferase [candidate division Zixibacteria bacterium]|nr:16S rRNA (uracil(1498)-N(3))-methyltransferase [candidate division Zixibacteria bacterium]
MTQTFIYDSADLKKDKVAICGAEAKHMASVLRINPGEVVRLIDGAGKALICEVVKIVSKQVDCRVIKSLKNSGEPSFQLTLACGISSSGKFDLILEKGTEIGVIRFIPLITEKGIVRLGGDDAIKTKMQRWQRVILAATKQSGRSVFPDITRPLSYSSFINGISPESALLFHPGRENDNIFNRFKKIDNNRLTVITGSESGFSNQEIETAVERGIPTVSLGNRILRAETAAVVFSSMAIYFCDSVKA